MTEQQAIVLLNALPGLGSVKVRKLIEYFGSATRAVSAGERELWSSEILSRQALGKILEFDRDNFLQNEYNLIQQNQVSVVTIFDENYPQALKSIHDPPVVLYVRGQLPLDNGVSVAVVGSRHASIYGLTVAETFSSQLAECGFNVISGLAKGIDAAAHRGCLKTGGQTVAVIGCGLCHIYPEENKDLYGQISRNGAVVSEFPMATPPISFNFPARNRIISGLSLAVLVIEASLKSGALITSRFALEQGRDVFAVPGKIDQPNSQGVNRLIKEGAKLVTCFEDILEELEPELRRALVGSKGVEQQAHEDNIPQNLNDDECAVVKCLTQQPLYIDDLAEKSGHPQGQVAGILLKLELRKIIKQLPGKYYVRA
ncbi:MAG: DNA-protecting protein DprA [Candidatus Omnitrophica bacterium]|nr:DNA-protecting protein DprA [Candidatus Omnitrophota bacterium]